MSIVSRLRARLIPSGTAPIVRLQLNGCGIFNHEFITKCIDEMERMDIRIALGNPPTELEKLAIHLLLDSADIDLEHERKQRKVLNQ